MSMADSKSIIGTPVTQISRSGKEALSEISLHLRDGRRRLGGKNFQIVGKQLEILVFLARHKGQVVSKDMLLDHLYPDGNEPDMKIIDVFICKLRRKLTAAMQETGGGVHIETVWGRGYILRDQQGDNADAPPKEGKLARR